MNFRSSCPGKVSGTALSIFEIATKVSEKKKLKRGRGSQRQSNVAVMAESTPLEDPGTREKSSHCRYFKMKVLTSHRSEEIDETVEENFDERSIVFSDKSTSYVNISHYVEMHIMEKSGKETTATTLKWVHIAIANAKRTLLGIYHKIKGKTYRIISTSSVTSSVKICIISFL